MKSRTRSVLAFLLTFAMLVLPLRVQAQAVFVEFPEAKLLTPSEEAAFHRIFATTSEQRAAVSTLVAGAKEQVAQAERKARAIADAFYKQPKDRQTRAAR